MIADPWPGRSIPLPLATLEWIDEVCTRFEHQWRSGARPDLRDYLDGEGTERAALFRELLKLDLEYRLKRGEQPTAEEYRPQFPAEFGGEAFESLLRDPGFQHLAPLQPTEDGRASTTASLQGPLLTGKLARYRIEGVLGQGAFGTVYRAEDRELRRFVALKMANEARQFRGDVDASLTEARALASLDHPAIIPVYDAGRADGRSYIVTKLIEGSNLSERLRLGLPTRRQAAEWVAAIARGLHAAHETGLVHRDVKPSNILITPSGAAYIGDFGLALARANAGDGPRLLGTPAYMSPEQARGEGHRADARSDVFSLGAVLYELLAGRPPFQAESVTKVLRQVIEHEPVPPLRLNPTVGRDLDTICLKCLEKSPERRYASAGALAEDLERHLANRSILARPANPVEKLVRWGRRNPAAATASAVTIATFLAAFVLVSWSYVRTEQAFREEASQRQEVQRRMKAERWERYRSEMISATNALESHNAEAARDALTSAPPEYRNWEWRHFSHRLDIADFTLRNPSGDSNALISADASLAVFADATASVIDLRTRRGLRGLRIDSPIREAVLSPDGGCLAVRRDDRTVTFWDIATGRLRATWIGPESDLSKLNFNRDGTRLAACCRDQTVRVVDTSDGSERLTLRGHRSMPEWAEFSPDGRRVATAGGPDRTARLWDLTDGRMLMVLEGHRESVMSVLFSPRGDRLATSETYPGNRILLWDADTGRPLGVLQGHANEVYSWAFSPDGGRLATGSYDQTIRLWDARSARPLATMSGHKGWVTNLAFSPDGRRLASDSQDRTLRLWDANTGEPLAVVLGQSRDRKALHYTRDGETLVVGGDGVVRILNARRVERDGALKGHTGFVYDVAFHPDGRRVASAAWDGTVRLWDATSGETLATLTYPESSIVSGIAFHPGGKLLASVGRDNCIRLWEVDGGRQVGRVTVPGDVDPDCRIRFSPRGDLLACGGIDRAIHIQKITLPTPGDASGPSGEEVAVLRAGKDRLVDLVFAPGGDWVAVADVSKNAKVRVWDLTHGGPVRVLEGHTGAVQSLAVSRDGRWLASGSSDGTIRLWDTADWTPAAVLTEGSNVYGLAFSPDGTRLASGCGNNTIRLWDPTHRQPVGVLHGHDAYVHQVAFSPDGTRLASASGDFTVRIWDALSPGERAAGEPAGAR